MNEPKSPSPGCATSSAGGADGAGGGGGGAGVDAAAMEVEEGGAAETGGAAGGAGVKRKKKKGPGGRKKHAKKATRWERPPRAAERRRDLRLPDPDVTAPAHLLSGVDLIQDLLIDQVHVTKYHDPGLKNDTPGPCARTGQSKVTLQSDANRAKMRI